MLVLAHTSEIIKQTSTKLFAHGIEHGIIQAGYMTKPGEVVQVASIQTLWARAVRTDRMELPPADLLIIDEAHHARHLPTARSSTPIRRPCCSD